MAQRMTTTQHHMTTSSTGGSSQTQVVRQSYQVQQQQQQQQQTQQTFQQYGVQQQPTRMQYHVQQTQGTTTQSGFPSGAQVPGQTMRTETVKQTSTVRTQQFGGVRTPFQAAQQQPLVQPQQNQPGAQRMPGNFSGPQNQGQFQPYNQGQFPQSNPNQFQQPNSPQVPSSNRGPFQQPNQKQFQQPSQGQFPQTNLGQYQQPAQNQFQQPNKGNVQPQGQFKQPNQGQFQQPSRGSQNPIPQQNQMVNRPNVPSPQPAGQVQSASPTPQGHYVPKRVLPQWPPRSQTPETPREQFEIHSQGPVDWPPAHENQDVPQQQTAPGKVQKPQGLWQQPNQAPGQSPGTYAQQPGAHLPNQNKAGGVSPQVQGQQNKQPAQQMPQQKGPFSGPQPKAQQQQPFTQKVTPQTPMQSQNQQSPQPRKQQSSPFQQTQQGVSQPTGRQGGPQQPMGNQSSKPSQMQPSAVAAPQSNVDPNAGQNGEDPKFLYQYTVGKLGNDAYGNWEGHSYDPTLPLIKPKGDGHLAKEWPPKNAGGPNMTMTYPSAFKLRDEAPIDHQTLPLTSVPSQPAFKISQPMRKLGDEVWPPKGAFQDVPTTEVRELIQPEKSNKNYDEFFATNALPNNYPGYKAPPGTQHVGEMEEAHPL